MSDIIRRNEHRKNCMAKIRMRQLRQLRQLGRKSQLSQLSQVIFLFHLLTGEGVSLVTAENEDLITKLQGIGKDKNDEIRNRGQWHKRF